MRHCFSYDSKAFQERFGVDQPEIAMMRELLPLTAERGGYLQMELMAM
jgi:hypothetical protein